MLAGGWSDLAFAQAGAPQAPTGAGGARRLDIEARARAEYDSNVARGNGTVATLRGLRMGDIKYQPSVSVDAGMPVGRQFVFLQASGGYEFYQRNKSLERERLSATGGVGGRLARCQAVGSGTYTRGTTDYEDLTLGAQQTVQETISGALFADCPIGPSIRTSAGYEHSELRKTGSRLLPNSKVDSVTGALSYGSPTAGSISLTGSYQTTTYDQAALANPAASPGFDSYSVGLAYTRPIGARLVGQAAASYFDLKSKSSAVPGQTGWSANVGFNYRASARLSGQANYSRNIGATRRIGSNSSLTERARLGGTYRIGTKIKANAGVSWTRRTFDAPPNAAALLASREETKAIRAGLSVPIGRRISVILDASHEIVDTDVAALDYKADKVGVTLTARY